MDGVPEPRALGPGPRSPGGGSGRAVGFPRPGAVGRKREEARGPDGRGAQGRTRRADEADVREWLATWMDEAVKPSRRPNTVRVYGLAIGKHIGPAIGAVPLQALRAGHIQKYHGEKRTDLSDATLGVHHAILTSALKSAVRQGLVAKNVATLVDGRRACVMTANRRSSTAGPRWRQRRSSRQRRKQDRSRRHSSDSRSTLARGEVNCSACGGATSTSMLPPSSSTGRYSTPGGSQCSARRRTVRLEPSTSARRRSTSCARTRRGRRSAR